MKLKRVTQELAESFGIAIAMHVDENYPELDEHTVSQIEGELQDAVGYGLESAWERSE